MLRVSRSPSAHTHVRGVPEPERSHTRLGCPGAGALTHMFGVSGSPCAHTHAQGVREPERSHTRSGCPVAQVLTHTFGVSSSPSTHTHARDVPEPECSYTCLGCPGARAVFEGDLMTWCMGQGTFQQQRPLTVWAGPLAERSPAATILMPYHIRFCSWQTCHRPHDGSSVQVVLIFSKMFVFCDDKFSSFGQKHLKNLTFSVVRLRFCYVTNKITCLSDEKCLGHNLFFFFTCLKK